MTNRIYFYHVSSVLDDLSYHSIENEGFRGSVVDRMKWILVRGSLHSLVASA